MRNKFDKWLKIPCIFKSLSSLREEVDRNLNLSMFLEDVRLSIMPISEESDRASDFAVEVQGNSDDKNSAVAILEGPPNIYGDYRWDSLEELLSDVVEMLVGTLLEYGRSVHKIAKIKENSGTHRLHNFLCQHFLSGFGKYIQIIPKEDRDLAYEGYPILPGLWNKVYVIIPKKDIWAIEMPKKLGGYRGYRAMLRNLARFPDVAPPFLMDQLSNQEWPTSFDPQLHERERAFFVAKATKRWGWDQRDSNLENWSEFYGFYRTLTLKWAQACLREHIVKELNQLFRRLDIEAEIVVKGLPTAWEILKIRQQMCEGKISFIDAFEKCLV